MAENEKNILENIGEQEYKYGFTTDIETETIGKGLSEEVVRLISAKKGEPEWMTERLAAARTRCQRKGQRRKKKSHSHRHRIVFGG